MWVTAACLLLVLACPVLVRAQPAALPTALGTLQLESLAGEWHEIAAYGWWWQRRCVADTRYTWAVRGPRALDVTSWCKTTSGVEMRSGRIRASRSSPGRLSARFAPAALSWLPGAWSDYWVIGRGEDPGWLLVGDRRRQRLAVLSRWVVLDEATLATAIAVARREGFETDRLQTVPQARGAVAVSDLLGSHAAGRGGGAGYRSVPRAQGVER